MKIKTPLEIPIEQLRKWLVIHIDETEFDLKDVAEMADYEIIGAIRKSHLILIESKSTRKLSARYHSFYIVGKNQINFMATGDIKVV